LNGNQAAALGLPRLLRQCFNHHWRLFFWPVLMQTREIPYEQVQYRSLVQT
jgi:hypothetical protein